ncbi:FBD-associated F-box protein [Trifolium repens]|nr:FBD-associated F-box protein [Trifolium repens]
MELEQEDRLSSLPKIILYEILSRLPEEDATRTSVLSKTWLDTWNTFPILSVSITDSTENILRFCDYVKRRMLRFRDQSLAIKTFKLRVHLPGVPHMSKDVDIWLKLACESGVEVIKFSIVGSIGQEQYYDLPMCVIEAKSLTKLVLFGSIKIEPTFVNHSNKFFSLKELSMTSVRLRDEQTIQHLISCCPLIEDIYLRACYVLSPSSGTIPINALSLSGLQKLKRVGVLGIQEVFIDAPSLEKLSYGHNDPFNAPFKIDFDRCRNLKELHLKFVESTFFMDKWFLDLFPKFPFLESLKLFYCKLCEKISISSERLKVLKLFYCSNFKEVNIDAPSLLSCKCTYYRTSALKPIISFLRNSSQLKVKIMTEFDFEDLCNLRKFVQNIKPHSVLTSLSLYIIPPSMDALNPIELQVTSPPPSIKNLELSEKYFPYTESFPHNESLFSSLVNIILSSCCPSTISFSLIYYISNRAFIEFFYEMLMRRKDCDCFCSSSDIKCWWHDLKDVKVTNSMKMDENVDLKTILDSLPMKIDENVDLETILDSLPTSKAREKISFMLEF